MTDTTQPPAETLAIIEMLQAAEVQEGVTVFDHSAEEIGIAVMENHRAILAALDSRAGDAGEGLYPDNTYTPYGRRSVHNLAKLLGMSEENPTVVSVVNRAIDEITFLRTLSATPAPAVDAQEGDDEGPCTDCEDTGITIQTERACSCEAGDQYRPPAVDAVPAGEGYTREQINSALRTARSNAMETFGIRWAHLEEISRIELTLSALASLSHGEGRK